MKTRNGFVSNSSSSSFIIAVKKLGVKKLTKPCSCCGITHISLLPFMRECYKDYGNSEASEIEADDRDHIVDKWKEYLGWSVQCEDIKVDLVAHLKKRLMRYNDKKWDLAWVKISYHDDILKTLFADMVKNKSIEIIEDMQ